MHIDQKHITTIRLPETRPSDLVLRKDGPGYRLTMVTQDDVVHLLLTPHQLLQLGQEMGKAGLPGHLPARPVSRDVLHSGIQEHLPAPPREGVPGGSGETSEPFHEGAFDWLSFN